MQTINIYSYDELNEAAKQKAISEIQENEHYLGDVPLFEAIESLKGFSNYYNLSLTYSLSIIPDRGEHITATIEDDDLAELSGVRLFKYLTNNFDTYISQYTKKRASTLAGDCPFTGVCYDEFLLDEIRSFMKQPDERTFQELINDCTTNLKRTLHNEGEYIYSDEGIKELLEGSEGQNRFYDTGNLLH